jgi:hypothetical protein
MDEKKNKNNLCYISLKVLIVLLSHSPHEVTHFLEECDRLEMMVVPLIQTFGHVEVQCTVHVIMYTSFNFLVKDYFSLLEERLGEGDLKRAKMGRK